MYRVLFHGPKWLSKLRKTYIKTLNKFTLGDQFTISHELLGKMLQKSGDPAIFTTWDGAKTLVRGELGSLSYPIYPRIPTTRSLGDLWSYGS